MTSGLLSVPLEADNCQNPDTVQLVSKGQRTQNSATLNAPSFYAHFCKF